MTHISNNYVLYSEPPAPLQKPALLYTHVQCCKYALLKAKQAVISRLYEYLKEAAR